jgi:hypothetical protein
MRNSALQSQRKIEGIFLLTFLSEFFLITPTKYYALAGLNHDCDNPNLTRLTVK